jgi:hypothetical protein
VTDETDLDDESEVQSNADRPDSAPESVTFGFDRS